MMLFDNSSGDLGAASHLSAFSHQPYMTRSIDAGPMRASSLESKKDMDIPESQGEDQRSLFIFLHEEEFPVANGIGIYSVACLHSTDLFEQVIAGSNTCASLPPRCI